jgi:hypothetical protein
LRIALNKTSIKWVSEDGTTVYTGPEPFLDVAVDEEGNLLVQIFTDSKLTSVKDRKIKTASDDGKSFTDMNDVVFNYDTVTNSIPIHINYRHRNLRIGKESAYVQALNYAYENIKLKSKIAALEELLLDKQTKTEE